MKTIVMALCLGATLLFSSGCGVYMAFTQPPAVDITAFEAEGVWSRAAVIDKLGPPVSSARNEDGTRKEIYQFYEGSSTGWKVFRGLFHLGADVFTLALWEIVAWPSELLLRGDKLTAQATFDKNDRLTSFYVVGREEKPLEKIHKQQNGP